jgi:hypothetical protein
MNAGGGHTSVRLGDDRSLADELARRTGETLSEVVRRALRAYAAQLDGGRGEIAQPDPQEKAALQFFGSLTTEMMIAAPDGTLHPATREFASWAQTWARDLALRGQSPDAIASAIAAHSAKVTGGSGAFIVLPAIVRRWIGVAPAA